MAKRNLSEEWAEALAIARLNPSYLSGLSQFRRAFPELSKDVTLEMYRRAFQRMDRVRYLEETNRGQLISRTRLGCGATGNYIMGTYRVSFLDRDNNQHDHYIHSVALIGKRIGSTVDLLHSHIVEQLRDSNYFRGSTLFFVESRITSMTLVQVRCFAEEI